MVKPKEKETRADFLERCIELLYVDKKVNNVTEAENECMLIWKKYKKGENK